MKKENYNIRKKRLETKNKIREHIVRMVEDYEAIYLDSPNAVSYTHLTLPTILLV